MNQRPNLRAKTTKLLEGNTREKLNDIGSGNDLLDMTSRVEAKKEKIGKLNYIKIKTFASKDTTEGRATHRLRENIHKSHNW